MYKIYVCGRNGFIVTHFTRWKPKKSLLERSTITYNWITREIANQKQLTTKETLH
jgi:hypothetical protein